ncbi:MAG: Tim44 domain-containing protein, partial [Proteobacteria bacterium]|nr:Tim44 domain-containing protein [Pseudomonadota bacterium]
LLLAGGALLLFRMFMARRSPAPAAAAGPAPAAPAWMREAPVAAPAATFGHTPSPFPPGFDADGFARQALAQFRALQSAWDRGDRAALAAVMTPALYAEVTGTMKGGGWSVVNVGSVFPLLDAEVVDVATEGREHWASVRFHGTVREDGNPVAAPFDEQWNLVKPVDGSSGWLVAGIQQTMPAL